MYTPDDIRALLSSHYNLSGTVKSLPGEADLNFLVTTDTDDKYTLKISPPSGDRKQVIFHTDMMRYLSDPSSSLHLPRPIPTLDGQEIVTLDGDRLMRLQTWVDGRMMADIKPRTDLLLQSWGRSMGEISSLLQGYDHPAAHRSYKWNPSEALLSKQYLPYIKAGEELEMANYFWNLFENDALPYLGKIRKSVNHNDGHELNLLVSEDLYHPQVTGLIDFGDALYTETINELAIACAYACMDMPDPLAAAAQVVQGYHEVFPITTAEIQVLYPLICARLMITVASAAYNKHQDPDNEYLVISERPAWELLKKFRTLSPALVEATLRDACGYDPCKTAAVFSNWISQHTSELSPIVDVSSKHITQLDLTVGSHDLGHNNNFLHIDLFDQRINQILRDNDADYGIGGYLETRPFYTSDAYEVEGNHGAQWRTVHLGMDVWTEDNCQIYAPWDGVVHSSYDNVGDCDYGPTIIIKHKVSDDLTFYTLYGHLARTSLSLTQQGQQVKRGQHIGYIGNYPENGKWPPHLHFQVMLDMLDNAHDFPGVAYPDQVDVWASICPDPSPFFQFEFSKKEAQDPAAIIADRKTHLGKSLSLSYNSPLHIVRGHMQYLYDTTGRRYLDTCNNVPHVGHQHPRVVRAAQRQLALLNTNTRYLHEDITAYAKELTATMPEELSVVHFVNSGSEANELAMRMAKIYSGQKDMLAIEVGYHGNTGACVDVSSYKFDGEGGTGAPPLTHLLPIPDIYRGHYKDPITAGRQYADHTIKIINTLKSEGRQLAGFIGESILSCGGQIVLPQGYLQRVYELVRAEGALCIADEVQVGMGRVGDHFWGFQLQEVVPDIVTIGKPIGNGHPLGAVICTPAVADAFANGMEYFNTFGGNPVSCAIGREVLSVTQDEDLQSHALQVGNYMLQRLRDLQHKHPIIGDLRGHGFFIGFELVSDLMTLTPAATATSYLANRLRKRGILASTDGPYHNVIKIKPPMCFTQTNADYLIDNIDKIMNEDVIQSFSPR